MSDDPRRGMPEGDYWMDWRGSTEARRSADERIPAETPQSRAPRSSRAGSSEAGSSQDRFDGSDRSGSHRGDDESRFVSPGRYDPSVWEPEPARWHSEGRPRGMGAAGAGASVSPQPPAVATTTASAAPSAVPASSVPTPAAANATGAPAAVAPGGSPGAAASGPEQRPDRRPLLGTGATRTRRLLLIETVLVLALSLGQSAWYSILRMIDRLTSGTPLNKQTSSLNTSVTPGRPWLDLTYQLSDIVFGVVPALLAVLLLMRVAPPRQGVFKRLGLTSPGWGHDVGAGLVIAAFIGIPGIGLYVVSKELGFNTTVQASGLHGSWWVVPVLILSAAMNAVLEETVMVGYLTTRWRQIGWNTLLVVGVSALIRGTYHLYQGWGGFAGNIVMGVVFGLIFVRRGRLMPLIVAHTVMDVVSFVGYTFLVGRIPWL